MTDLLALLTRAGEVLEPFAKLAEYCAEHHPGWDHDAFNFHLHQSQDGKHLVLFMRHLRCARALHAEITAALADAPVTTEQLDKLQFGRVLHERPVPDDGWRDISSAPKDETGEQEILVYGGDGHFVACWDRISGCFCEASSGNPLDGRLTGAWCAPTHWRPLPLPPPERKEPKP